MRQGLLSPQLLLAAATTMSIGSMVHSANTTKKRVVCGPSKLNRFVAQGMQPALDKYTPAWWTNEHIQILLTFVVPQTRVEFQREILALLDGGQASLDWAVASDTRCARQDLPADAPIVVILHGLTGSSVDMQSLCAEALERGYRPVVFNKRGHGGVKLTTPVLQGFGCVDDLKLAVAHIERAFPLAKLYGVGTSAGSGLLCSYLGSTGDQSRIRAGVMISPGYNTFDLFCKGLVKPLYNFLMTRSLQTFLRQHQDELRGSIDVDAALSATSIQEFDEHVYMKMHGHADIVEYWKHNNPIRELDRAARPILCINALDDPVCTKESIPMDIFESNPERMLVETERGSHCAFYQGNGNWRLENWSDGAALTYLDRVRAFERLEAAYEVAAA